MRTRRQGSDSAIRSAGGARAAVIEKPYEALDGTPAPVAFTGREPAIESQPVLGDPDLQVRSLVPADVVVRLRA